MRHGYARREKNRHPLYNIWSYMLSRCYNGNDTSYSNYGGRGITVCDEWVGNPVSFIEWSKNNGWEKGLYLDRKDNDGHYTPENCRFVSVSISNINQRKRKDNTSGLIGIHFHKGLKKHRTPDTWDATLQYQRKRFFVGSYNNPIEAAIARDTFIKEKNLPHKLNFCDTGASD